MTMSHTLTQTLSQTLSTTLPLTLRSLCMVTVAAVQLTLITPLVAQANEAAAQVATKPSFSTYLADLKQQAAARGYAPALIEQAFADIRYREKVVGLDKKQPEFTETLASYLPKRIPDWKVDKAVELYKTHQALLDKIAVDYQVQPRFIVALWGLESNFGKITGQFPVVASLVTLAYEGRRRELYEKQLWAAMDILSQSPVAFADFKGSWAGAMGQTQFMPTSYLAYAQDYDNDGHKDIWRNQADVFASIANYLKQEGWQGEQTWGRRVQLPKGFDLSNAVARGSKGREQWLANWQQSERSLAQWQALGVRRIDGSDLPKVDVNAALIIPDEGVDRAYLVYSNYKTLMHWNRSYLFATSVGYLADKIAARVK